MYERLVERCTGTGQDQLAILAGVIVGLRPFIACRGVETCVFLGALCLYVHACMSASTGSLRGGHYYY